MEALTGQALAADLEMEMDRTRAEAKDRRAPAETAGPQEALQDGADSEADPGEVRTMTVLEMDRVMDDNLLPDAVARRRGHLQQTPFWCSCSASLSSRTSSRRNICRKDR